MASRRPHLSDRAQLGLMLAPYLIGISILTLGPAIAGFAIAFTHYNAINPPRFAGLANFREMLNDDVFRIALGNSLRYILLAVPLRLFGAFVMALLLLKPRPGTTLFRVMVYLPTVIPDMAWALIWLWILNPIYGPLNRALALIGIDGPSWMVDATWAPYGIVLMMIWQIGEGFVISLAALQNVSRDLLDQSAIDGGSMLRTIWNITLPTIAPALLIVLLRDTVFSFQANFVPALIVGNGGDPKYATLYLPMYIYTTAFGYLRFGYAAAMTLSMYVVTGAILWAQFRAAKRWNVGFQGGD
ncbi:MAG: sugar ABC transporter permease [Thermomicrobiales bacterium]|nr:sugar ABC transporter permease [Thermomicrobiales bacterium]